MEHPPLNKQTDMGKADKRTFLFSIDWYEVLADYPEGVRLEVYETIIRYASTGTFGELKPLAKMAFSFIKKEMDYNARQYEEVVERRREAGRRGGLTTQSKQDEANSSKAKQNQANLSKVKQSEANSSHNDNVNDNDIYLKEKTKKEKKQNYAENVTLTQSEYEKLCETYTEQAAKRMIEILDNYKGQDGKRYKSDYRAILNWVVGRYNEEIGKYGNGQHFTSSAKSAGGIASSPEHAAGAIPAATGAGPQPCDAEEKDYSERF